MAISKEQFTWLFINATCLSELALIELASDGQSAQKPVASPSTGEVDMDSVQDWIGDSDGEFDLQSLLNAETELVSQLEQDVVSPAIEFKKGENPHLQPGGASELDIGSYIEWAYRDFDQAARIASSDVLDGCHQEIEGLLGMVSGPRMQLCARNTELQMKYWLEVYQSGDEDLARLVAKMRSLQSGSSG